MSRLRYALYAGCCFMGADARWLELLTAVMGRFDVEFEILEQGLCCGSGVIEERSELTSLAINARNLALAEATGKPLFIPCSTCFNVISGCRRVLAEDRERRAAVEAILADEGLAYTGNVRLTHPLWSIAIDVGLERLAREITTPLTGLRVAAHYGCHVRHPAFVQSYEPADSLRSLDNILRVLGVDVVEYETADACCGYHLTWPDNSLSLRMTSNLLCGAQEQGVDAMVVACPLCWKSLDNSQRKALSATGQDFLLPVLYLPELVGLACGMSCDDVGLGWHTVPLNLRV